MDVAWTDISSSLSLPGPCKCFSILYNIYTFKASFLLYKEQSFENETANQLPYESNHLLYISVNVSQFWQLWNSISLFRMAQMPESKEWQVSVVLSSFPQYHNEIIS